jgi:hypothetical protein
VALGSSVIKVIIDGDNTGIGRALTETEGKLKSSTSKFADFGKKVGLAFGEAAIAAGVFALKMGSELEDAQSKLENAAKSAGVNLDDWGSSLAKLQNKLEGWGVTNDKVDLGLARLVTSGENQKQAMDDSTLAANIAARTGQDYNTVVEKLAKAHNGATKSLRGYGVDLKNLDGTTRTAAQLHDELAKKYAGAGDAASKTASGGMKVLKAQFTDMAAKVGVVVIPILLKLAKWLTDHKPVLITFAAVVGTGLVAAFGAWAISAGTAAVATVAATWPVLAIAAAVAGLVIAVKLVWDNWDTIWTWIKDHKAYTAILAVLLPIPAFFILMVGALKELYTHWDEIWSSIKAVVQVVWDAIKPIVSGAFQVILGIFNFAMAVVHGNWSGAWDAIKQVVSGAWDAIVGAVQLSLSVISYVFSIAWGALKGIVSTAWDSIVTYLKNIPGTIGDAASWLFNLGKDIISGLVNGIKSAPSAIINAIKGMIPGGGLIGKAASLFGLAAGGTFPGFANGGVPSGSPFWVGEKGPELLFPSQAGRILSHADSMAAVGNGGGTTTVINNWPAGTDPSTVNAAQARYNKRNGLAA